MEMKQDKKLEAAANKIFAIMEDSIKDLPASERKARWRAFNETAANLETRAKPQAPSKAPASLRVGQSRA